MLNIVERKKVTPTTKMKSCPECNIKFSYRRRNRIYCSEKCKFRAWAKNHPRLREVSNVQ